MTGTDPPTITAECADGDESGRLGGVDRGHDRSRRHHRSCAEHADADRGRVDPGALAARGHARHVRSISSPPFALER